MGAIVRQMQVSADGYFEGPDGDLGWHRVYDELHEHFNATLSSMSAFPDGHVAYELMAGFWPTADRDPYVSRPVAEFAAIWLYVHPVLVGAGRRRFDGAGTPDSIDLVDSRVFGNGVVLLRYSVPRAERPAT